MLYTRTNYKTSYKYLPLSTGLINWLIALIRVLLIKFTTSKQLIILKPFETISTRSIKRDAFLLNSVKQPKECWKKVTGNFCAVNAALVSGCNRLSPTGIAPSSHLGNGCLDLLLVHKCSRVNFLRHLNRIGSSGNHVS